MDLQKIHQNVAEGQDKSSQWTGEKLEIVQIMDVDCKIHNARKAEINFLEIYLTTNKNYF